eukprot:CAMPEP_0180534806 /NCGR_PEP_ID=MMETSP1036_2-20121128/64382_1 /TAXON_ID=632150 /ORGANISM="Azadinium spinosum, Strain 3D9" /LENGTH=70 /DNA_ID=CAMNT_0022549165 /DNA_START=62 /DNA_END=271 /DNA_ORIENTATION=-
MIIYDLQMDLGGGRGGIHDAFVRQSYGKLGMKEYASQFLIQLLVRCPRQRYDILEVFNVAEVFAYQSVRP